jgi:DHA1 family bicyclomycin/chloramphenicol resistance-like MFS transporter
MKNNKFLLIVILGLMSAIGPFSIDMYLPAFTDIASHLHTSIDKVMLTLTSFFLGISFGQIIYGPLLERFGRKKPLYFGLTLYLLATIGCAFANSIQLLISLRLLQALGGCVGMVSSRAMVRDIFSSNEIAKMFSTLMLVVAVSPIIAPTLGGVVTTYLGWRMVFVSLFILVSIILLGIYFILPETKQPNPEVALKPSIIVANFKTVLQNPQFAVYTLTGSISYAGLYAYISGSPAVFLEFFKVSQQQYGWIFAIVAAGLIGASQINNLLIKRFKSEEIIMSALMIQTVLGLVFVSLSMMHVINVYSTIILVFLFLFCQGLTFPNASALSLTPFSNNAGNASAMMGFLQMIIGSSASFLVSLFKTNSVVPMATIMASCTIIALLILSIGQRRHLQQPAVETVLEEEVDMLSNL